MCYGFWLNDKSRKKGFEILKSTRIEIYPAKCSVFGWLKEFKDGNIESEHKPRSERPVSVTIESNVETVKEFVKRSQTNVHKIVQIHRNYQIFDQKHRHSGT